LIRIEGVIRIDGVITQNCNARRKEKKERKKKENS
jgi:hypothetical protein